MIERIRIQNFKSLRDVTVDLSPVTVLIGKSGTGKTNFASALKLLRNILSGKVNKDYEEYWRLKNIVSETKSFTFDVTFSIDAFDAPFEYHLEFDHSHENTYVSSEWLKSGSSLVFSQTADGPGRRHEWIQEPQLAYPPDPGPIALGRVQGIEEILIAHSALTAGIGVYDFPSDVMGFNREDTYPSGPGLDEDGGNHLFILRGLITEIQNIPARRSVLASLRKLNRTVNSIDLDHANRPSNALVGHKINGKSLLLNLNQESSGFRRFYAHLLALYQTPPKQTLVFEEPENGIFPGALGLLAEEFKAAPAAGRGQVILTTHSPALLDHFDADQIRVVKLNDHLETEIGPLADEQKEALQQDLLSTGELLTTDPARMQES